VASGPLVRSSYKAAEYYLAGMIRQRRELEAARAAAGTRSSGTPATELS